MQTREEAMANHPAGSALTVAPSEESSEDRGPYEAFFDAIAELEVVVEMYGTSSPEADFQRAVVRQQRERAASNWREHAA
jgi:hypothetical protein